MLPTPYHWLDNPDTCYLCFNYQTVAVLQMEAGRVAGFKLICCGSSLLNE